MGRGVMSGGGHSSLGYLFGSTNQGPDISGRPNNNALAQSQEASAPQQPADHLMASATSAGMSKIVQLQAAAPNHHHHREQGGAAVLSSMSMEAAAGVLASSRSSSNNYCRTAGQNRGNFITDRPSTKVHSPPGGISSLGYLFGNAS